MTLANQIFVRFYLVIVISVITVGWSVDYIWQSFANAEQTESLHESTLSLAAQLMAIPGDSSYAQRLESINQLSALRIELVPLEQINANRLEDALLRGETVILQNAREEYIAYQKVASSDFLLAMQLPSVEQASWSKYPLLIIFYALIALVVYWWTRPLTRDLKLLENAAKSFADSQWESKVVVPGSSPIRHLADAYNQLLARIKQLLSDQQEMSQAISHELRTPLARIKFSLELALNSQSPDKFKDQLQSISEDIVEIQGLVDELLSYASLEKSSAAATTEKGDIESLIVSLVEKLQRNSPDKQLSLAKVEYAPPVYCDSYLIERALQNLIINALNHCNSQVKVSFEQRMAWNQLYVDDDGGGISSADRERVFDSFVRLDNQPKKRRGFGLGLTIVKRIALLHQGKVSVDTSTMGGARFIFAWPNTLKGKKLEP